MQTREKAKLLDVIIVSDQKDERLKSILFDTIDSLIRSSEIVNNIIVVEGQLGYGESEQISNNIYLVSQDNKDGFNYNRNLNHGVRFLYQTCKADDSKYIAFCNSDLLFSDEWDIDLIGAMEKNGCGSGSPIYPNWGKQRGMRTEIGYEVGKHFSGWCFVLSFSAYRKIGGLSEEYTYWCSDNIVCEQLKSNNIKHILCAESIVNHLWNQTGKTIDRKNELDYTWRQAKKFEDNTGIALFPKEQYKRRGL